MSEYPLSTTATVAAPAEGEAEHEQHGRGEAGTENDRPAPSWWGHALGIGLGLDGDLGRWRRRVLVHGRSPGSWVPGPPRLTSLWVVRALLGEAFVEAGV